MKLGVFGGTFNPIHYGHLRAAEEVREKLNLDKIVFVPSGNPPLKDKGLIDASYRYTMVKVAVSINRFFAVSDIEYIKKGKSYSVNTLKKLHHLYPGTTIYFILGIDAFIDMPNWWHPDELVKLTDFIVISRPPLKFTDISTSPFLGADEKILRKLDSGKIESYKTRLKSGREIIMLRLTPVAISATGVRKLIREGKSIKYLLPEEVESYIIANKLYKVVSGK
ncbi:MAG: nicotinate-nucleotide adenylyltransferase [Nitrospirae bacterium]|nr:nicotinate-nucleotide adenylyltransferase [Nitrospirota bacterium]